MGGEVLRFSLFFYVCLLVKFNSILLILLVFERYFGKNLSEMEMIRSLIIKYWFCVVFFGNFDFDK